MDKKALWRSWQTWQREPGRPPSDQLGIDYPWVAQDLNRAVSILGGKVRDEYDKALEAEREGRTTIDEKGRKKRPTLTDAERNNVWFEVFSRIVRGKIVFHSRKVQAKKGEGGGVLLSPTGEWIRIEKPITGDPDIDNRKNRGERTVIEVATGKIIERWNADGVRVQ